MVYGYMFYGTWISNKPFLEFSGFHVHNFLHGGRQYKCHNIFKNYVILRGTADCIGQLGGYTPMYILTFIIIHILRNLEPNN